MRQEFKVGLALLATVVALVLGIRFFDDRPLFGGNKTFTASLSRADGLASGNVVQVNGVTVGKVGRVALDPETRRVNVTFTVENSARLTQGTTAGLGGFSALGGVRLDIVPGPLDRPLLTDGSEIPERAGRDVVAELQDKAPLLAARLDTLLLGAGLTVGETYSLVNDPNSDLRLALAQLRQATALVNELVRRQQAPLDATFLSAQRTLRSVEVATQGLPGTLAGFDATSAEARALVGDLRGVTYQNRDTVALAIARLNASMAQLQQTMARVDTTSRRADALLARVERGEGNLGMLLNDSTLYVRLDTTLTKTNGLLDDFRRNPARYLRHVKLVDIF